MRATHTVLQPIMFFSCFKVSAVNLIKTGPHKLGDKVEVAQTGSCLSTTEKICVKVNKDANGGSFQHIFYVRYFRE